MTSLAQFKTDYLNSTALTTAERTQVAGLVYALDQQIANGASIPTAVNNITTPRASRVLHRAQRRSNPFQLNLVNDFRGISSA